MATIPVHRAITERVLGEFGFSAQSGKIAADANAAVDEKQGGSTGEANLHAMGGKAADGAMQTKADTAAAVAKLLEKARNEIVGAIGSKQHGDALRRLGAALHTVQDHQFHHLESWAHDGIVEALLKDPGYMLHHAWRDLAPTEYLRLGSGMVAEDRAMMGAEAGYGLHDFLSNWDPAPDAIGLRAMHQSGGGQPQEWSGMLTLCWGACPGGTSISPAVRSTAPGRVLGAHGSTRVPDVPTWYSEWTRLSEELGEATKKSREFVESVKNAAGAGWRQFVR